MTTGPFARRMLAEGAVIVVSILLAFALDAWWDAVQREREVDGILAALDAEFAEVAEEIERAQLRHRIVIAAADTILAMLRSGEARIPGQRLGDLFRTPTTTPAQGALTALIASGRLELIPSRELQALLAGWPALLEDLKEEEISASRFAWEELLPYLSGVPGFGPTLYARQGVEIQGMVTLPISPETINLVEARRFFATMAAGERDRIQIDAVLERIRRDIRNHLN